LLLKSWLLTTPALLATAALPSACTADSGKTDKPAAAAKTAQTPDTTQVPKGYYLFPIQPGKPNFLSGSMGELRPNHFHGGL
ncbi:hypothetical protein NL361_28730, partial [Klebsiella pneumoniae]|nr:hypothetical protein [Klebsiella pneumoniae]